MTVGSVARMALAAVLLCPIPVMAVVPATAEPTAPCVGAGELADPLSVLFDLPVQEPDAEYSCEDKRRQCYSGATQEGIYGERYVPVEAVRMCEEAYRACVAAHEGLGPSAENAPYPDGAPTGGDGPGVPVPGAPAQDTTPPDAVNPPDSIPWPWPAQAPSCDAGRIECHHNATTALEHHQCDNALYMQCMQSKGPEAIG